MPNDVITLKAISQELKGLLTDGRVEKIYQPEQDEITLTIKNQRKIYTLVASANPSHPRLHVTSQKKENALVAPAFCMLLRKYLIGAFICNVEIFNSDRIIKITFNARTELKDNVNYFLIIELMGRYSNIILTSSQLKIIDAIRRIHFDQSTTRYILPNLEYVLQPQTRISLNDTVSLNNFFNSNKNLDVTTILKNVSGFSKDTAQEIIASDCPVDKANELINITERDTYQPCLRYENGKLRDYYVQPYSTQKGEYEYYNSLNECLDKFYSIYDGEERKKASTKTIVTILKRLQAKTDRRIEDNEKKKLESEEAEKYKLYGEFILAYSYVIKKGDEFLNCMNYYDNTSLSIPLNPNLTPAENAQAYYKKYNKAKRARIIAETQLSALKEQKTYLDTIAVCINNCSLKTEYDEILTELNALSGLRKSPKYSKTKPSKPLHFVVNGFDVYCGKNNIQNNEVTFNIASSKDLWLHVKAHHGSHLIIKGVPDEDTIHKCAKVCAYYSEARNDSKVEIDYTQRKNVKKIPSAMLGMVTYTNYRTILVEPCDYTEIQDK